MRVFLSFLAGVVSFYSFQYFPFSAVSVSLGYGAYLTARKNFLPAIMLCAGVLYAFLRYAPAADIVLQDSRLHVRGVVTSSPAETGTGGFRQNLVIRSAVDPATGAHVESLAGREVVLFSDRELELAREYTVSAEFLTGKERYNPGQQPGKDIYAKLLEVTHAGGESSSFASVIEGYRHRISSHIAENFKDDSAALVASVTTGQRSLMSDEVRDAFNTTGLAHILSISGTHFGLFSVFLFGIFNLLVNALPHRILQRITVYLAPSQAAAAVCLPVMLAYLCLSGASIPAIRAFIMISLFLTGLIIGRKGFWLNSLLFAAFLLVVWDPEVLFSLSFQLSFLAVLCIGFSLEEKEKSEEREKTYLHRVKKGLLISLYASLGTAPLVAYWFHYFSVISPLSNLLVAPIIGFVLIPASVAGAFLFLMTGHFVFTPVASAVADISIASVKLLSGVPFASITVPHFPPAVLLLFYAVLLLCLVSVRKKYLLVIPFIPLAGYLILSGLAKNELRVAFLDVGQGDSSVVELPDGKTMVIDTGRTGWETSYYLHYRGKRTIDYLVLTHVHPDHIGGLDRVVRKFSVKEIWDNGRMVLPETMQHIVHRPLGRGDTIEGQGYRISVLHPYDGFYTIGSRVDVGENNDSLVLRLEGRKKSFLFTGDIEEEALQDIACLGKWAESTVVKIPHHGGRTSAYQAFVGMVSPEFAVISVGRENPFGHPHRETLDSLRTISVYRTDTDGFVQFEERERGLEIRTYEAFRVTGARSLREEMLNYRRLFR